MPDSSSRRAALMDWAAIVGLAGPVLVLLSSFFERPAAITWALCAALAFSIAAWMVWRWMPRFARTAAVVFAFGASAVIFFGDGPLTFGAAWVACLVLARVFRAAVTVAYAVLLCLMAAGIHLIAGNGWEIAAMESVSTAVLAGFGAAFALLMKDADRVDAERAQLSEIQSDTLAQLSEANGELQRRLGSEQDLVLAEERARVARELHDELGHRLTVIGLSLDYVERMRGRDAQRADAELVRARSTVSDALAAMRKVVRAMHPVELGSLRGAAAFLAVAEAFRSTGLDVRVDVDGGEELSHEHSLLILRFVQEGLTNVVRHADATRVNMCIRTGNQGVRAVIEDVGGAGGVSIVEGFGLRSLRARAESVGGSLVGEAVPRGFRLEIVLPLDARVAA
ncbi:sensor histidine kinase [Microbacterium sp. A84]|uniref:sensor histidine kinase n=1 Tax=Microbacterium sp. A84 TaxID=3450715 RepID=UPI003F42C2A8